MGTKCGIIDHGTYTQEVFVSICGEISHGKMLDKASGVILGDGGSRQRHVIEELNQSYGSGITWKPNPSEKRAVPSNTEIFEKIDLLITRYGLGRTPGSPSYYTEWERIKDKIPSTDRDRSELESMLKQNSDYEYTNFESLR